MIFRNQILIGDSLETLRKMPDGVVQTCITSPPYWGLRDYGCDGQLGLEKTPDEYVKRMVEVFREVRRVLRDDGTLWLNIGDSYSAGGCDGMYPKQASNKGAVTGAKKLPDGYKPKDLVGIPWLLAFALRADGWYLRSDIIWHKPNPMPESVTDRPTKSHEYLFLLSKSQRYYYNADAIKEPASPDYSVRDRDNTKLNNTPGRTKMGGLVTNEYEYRNKRTVWTIPTQPYKDAHFATFPPALVNPCILAGSKECDLVLDPFGGSGTTGYRAKEMGRDYTLIELNPEYAKMAQRRLQQGVLNLKSL